MPNDDKKEKPELREEAVKKLRKELQDDKTPDIERDAESVSDDTVNASEGAEE